MSWDSNGLYWCDEAILAKDLSGKIILITGACGGIALETAKQLLRQNATVILTGHDQEKGEALAKDLDTEYMACDTGDYDSVREFAAVFKQKFDKLDVLVNSAAITRPDGREENKVGHELQMAVNFLGHFLLTELLTDLLKATPDSRVVDVSSCQAEKIPSESFASLFVSLLPPSHNRHGSV